MVKVGDFVRVKKWEDIEKMKNEIGEIDEICFPDYMKIFCNRKFVVTEADRYVELDDFDCTKTDVYYYLFPKCTLDVITESEPIKTSNNVSHPSHYTQGGIECKDAIASAVTDLKGFEAYATGNIIKYMWRWKHKNGIEDLKKAKQYIDFLIEEIGGNN